MEDFSVTGNPRQDLPIPGVLDDVRTEAYQPPALHPASKEQVSDSGEAAGEPARPGQADRPEVDERERPRRPLQRLRDRLRDPQRQEQRRQTIMRLIDGIAGEAMQGQGLDGFFAKYKQFRQLAPTVTALLNTLQDVQSVNLGVNRDGQLSLTITRGSDATIPVNQQQKGVNVKSVSLAKELSFNITNGERGIRLENIKGVKVNASVVGVDTTVELSSAGVERNDKGELMLRAGIRNPLLPNTEIPILVPLRPPANSERNR